ncbi:MAG: uroporphyrinogen-III synthase [Gammaproteobacteria bacterium]|nr:uroporphyrinogen-III synthase [Gammaproteobacteria bacterium]
MNVLVTRPLAQSGNLNKLILNEGHTPLLFPLLEITPLKFGELYQAYDAIIFISATMVFAVGEATAEKIKSYGVKVSDYPKGKASSEALLNLNSIKSLNDKEILIVRGKGGRETLKNGLVKSNNKITYLEAYERVEVDLTDEHTQNLNEFLKSSEGVVVLTSNESIDAFVSIVSQIQGNLLEQLKSYPVVLLSPRIREYMLDKGFNNLHIASDVSDAGLFEKIQSFST